jgi:transposase
VFPEFKQKIKELDTPTILELLRRYPLPSKILMERENVLVKFIKKHSRGNKGEQFVKEIREMAKDSIGVPDENGVIGYRITFLVERLIEVQKALKALSDEIKTRTDNNEIIGFIDDIKGIERVRAASLCAELGPIEQFDSARKVQGYGGVTPRVFSSGSVEVIGRPTKAVNHYLRNTVSVLARSITQHSEEFKAVFIREKLKGKSNTQAYIIVGNRLLYHAYSIMKNKKPYRVRMPQLAMQTPHPTVSHR